MKKLKIVIIFFILTGCQQADPGSKKHPLVKRQVVSESVTDSYIPSVDILFIIDNSSSMNGIQELLAKNAQLFIDEFLDADFIDYHIAVTNSTVGSGIGPSYGLGHGHGSAATQSPSVKRTNSNSSLADGNLAICKYLVEESGYNYPNYVDRNTPRAGECLGEMMKVGTESRTNEFFFNVPILALSKKGLKKNSLFYRPEAHLAIFIITDSYDQSDVTAEQSYQFLLDLKGGDKRKIHYAAGIITFEVLQYRCSREERPPTDFIRMVKFFGSQGYQFNICQFDFGKDVAYFARHLIDSALTIPLNHIPNVDTIEVRYNYKGVSQLISNGSDGWSYDTKNNLIHLSRDIQLDERMGVKNSGRFDIKYEPFYIPETKDPLI